MWSMQREGNVCVCVCLARWSSPARSLGKLKAALSGIRERVLLGVAEGGGQSTGGFWELGPSLRGGLQVVSRGETNRNLVLTFNSDGKLFTAKH